MSIPSEVSLVINQLNSLSTDEINGVGMLLGFNYDSARLTSNFMQKCEFINTITRSHYTIEKIADVCGYLGRRDVQVSLRNTSFYKKPISQLFNQLFPPLSTDTND